MYLFNAVSFHWPPTASQNLTQNPFIKLEHTNTNGNIFVRKGKLMRNI